MIRRLISILIIGMLSLYNTPIYAQPEGGGASPRWKAPRADDSELEPLTTDGTVRVTLSDHKINIYNESLGVWEKYSGGGGVTDHDLLNNLDWSVAGHVIDTNLQISENYIEFGEITTPPAPGTNFGRLYVKDKAGVSTLYFLDDVGTETELGGGGSGGATRLIDLTDVDPTLLYTNHYILQGDGTKYIGGTYSHTWLDDVGTYTHTQIDSHILDLTNPHSVTTLQIGAMDLLTDQSVDGIKTFIHFPETAGIPTTGNQLVNKDYADNLALGFNWSMSPVEGQLTAPPGSPLVGQQWIVLAPATGDWTGLENHIERWNGSGWTDYPPVDGYAVLDLSNNYVYRYIASILAWKQVGAATAYTATNGITKESANFKLGGYLVENTNILAGNYSMIWNLNSTGQFQIQDSGTDRFIADAAGNIGIGYPSPGGIQLYVRPQTVGTIGLGLRANAGQTANLFVVQDSTPTTLLYIDPNGYVNSTMTVDQTALPSLSLRQNAVTDQTIGGTGTAESFDNTWEAVKFTASGDYNIRAWGIRIKRTGTFTNPTAYITGYIYADNAGVPGSALGSSSRVYYGSLGTSYATIQFNTGAVALTSGTTYWLVLRQSAAPAGATVEVDRNSTGTATHAYSADGTIWTTENNKTMRAYLYGRTGYGLYVNSQTNYAGYFDSINTYAVYANSLYGSALYGNSTNGYGVYGNSLYSYGVYGASTYNTGVYGSTTSGTAIYGNSASGASIYGVTTSGYGVRATSTTGTSLYCSTTSGVGAQISANPATTNSLHEMQRWTRTTSATAANGIGIANNYYLENDAGASANAARMSVLYTNAAAGSESSAIGFWTRTEGTAISEKMRLDGSGRLGIGTTSPTALLTLKAGTATAGTAPIKLTAGTSLTTPENGAIEFDGTHLYITIGGVRYQLDQQGGASADEKVKIDAADTTSGYLDAKVVAGSGITKTINNVGGNETVTIAANNVLGATDAIYFGDPSVDGTWRIIRDGNDLVQQRREAGTYVTKMWSKP